MSCDFKPGDEVVCVDDSDDPNLFVPSRLSKGSVYTVTEIAVSPYGRPCVRLQEVLSPGWKGSYRYSRFRKAQRRNPGLTIEALSVIKDGGFEEPKRTPSKEKAKEKAQ